MSPTPIEIFLLDIDAEWPAGGSKILLRVIGSTALMLQTPYSRGTKDSDVLGVDPVIGRVADALLALAGKDTDLHRKRRVYLDVVGSGVPLLPRPPKWNRIETLNANLRSFEIVALDITDVVVSKLKRVNDNDMADIREMVGRDLVDHAHLVDRFLSAADVFSMDARAQHLTRYAQNLNWVERECMGVPATEYQLPPWADA
jgi:hypothetical protein